MRKLIALLLLLCCAAMTAQAETPAVDEAILGSWEPVLPIVGDEIHFNATFTAQPIIIITADGINPVGYPPVPLLYSRAAGRWYMPDGTGTQEVFLIPDSYGQLIMHSGEESIILRRADAAPAELPPVTPALAIGGDWQARALYASRSDYSDGFSCIVDFKALDLPTPVITLPAFASYDAIAAAWQSAATQEGTEPVMAQLQRIYGYELINSDTLILVSSCGLIVMERVSTPAVDAAIAEHAVLLADWWRLVEVSLGGIPISPDACGVTNEYLAIDEQGNVQMDGSVSLLQLVDNQLCIGSYPLRCEGSTLYLQLADGVEARFITEAAWYRQQLAGTWQLSKMKVPALNMEVDVDPEVLDVTLIIQPDGSTAILRSAGNETSYALESTDDVIEYLLVGPETHTLTISSLSRLRLSNESETYTLWFKPAE